MAIQYFSGDSRYYIEYTVTLVSQDVANNRSQIRRFLQMVRASGSGDWSSSAVSSWKSWGPTNIPSGSDRQYFAFDFTGYGGPLTLLNTTQWVNHNADGTLTLYSEADVWADLSTGNTDNRRAWVGFNTVLPTIPRATTPNLQGGGGFTTGSAKQINLPRASSNFTHDVTYKFGSHTGTIATGAGVSTSWTPGHTLLTAIPNTTSGTVTITVVTKSGSTTIGSKSVNFTLSAASSVVPSVSGVTWSDANSVVAANIGAFISGLSLIRGSVSAAGVHGSSITARNIVVGGVTYGNNATFTVNGSGTVSAQGRATDSRGRVGALNTSFPVLGYVAPQIGSNGWNVRRANSSNVVDDNGTYLRIDLHAIATGLTVGGVQKNALKIVVRTRPTNGGWTTRNTVNPGLTQNGAIQVSGGAAYATSQSYEVEITITDNTSAPALILKKTVGTTVVAIDLKGNQVGIGKMHEQGSLDVAGSIYSSGNLVGGFTLTSAHPGTNPPSWYPVGSTTHMATDVGWPGSWGMVLTVKSLNYRAIQTYYSQDGTRMWTRNAKTATGSDTWEGWTEFTPTTRTATETATGLVERATQAEANAGTDTTRYVSPAGMRSYTRRVFSGENQGTAVNGYLTFAHGLGLTPNTVVISPSRRGTPDDWGVRNLRPILHLADAMNIIVRFMREDTREWLTDPSFANVRVSWIATY